MTENNETELLFTREGMKVRKKVELLGKNKWIEELIPYEEIRRMGRMDLLIEGIEPEIERGVLKCLRF